MNRSASQHSRAATNAFQRDDHASAQHHSLKARQHWSAAERLNAKAAREILSIRNGGNDLWKLDLHGLHAAEAIQALQERLQEIETQVHPNHSSLFPKGVSESSTFTDAEKLAIPSRRQRPTSLQVITGKMTCTEVAIFAIKDCVYSWSNYKLLGACIEFVMKI